MAFFGMIWFSFSLESEAFLTLEVLVAWLDFFFFPSWEELCEETTGTADLAFAFLIGLESALTGTFLVGTAFF